MDARDDIVVVGAGCAGLSLAVHLVERGFSGSIRIVDRRTRFGRDRTWCFWNVLDHPFEDCIEHRWSRWRTRAPEGRNIDIGGTRYDYCCIPSDRFYAHALARLEKVPSVTVELGVTVDSVSAIHPEEGEVRLADGQVRRGRHVFDSRPLAMWSRPEASSPEKTGDVRLLQHFAGWEIETEHPCFKEDIATLMDFEVHQRPALHFIYILPFSPTRALIETTYFSASVLSPQRYQDDLHDYLEERFGLTQPTILMKEQGVIPMTTEALSTGEGGPIHSIGLRGGVARPSTGYAFLNIQRDSERVASWLMDASYKPLRRKRTQFLDHVLLSYLSRHPKAGPQLFSQLMEHCPPEILVRFLSECSTPLEDLRVMTSVPMWPMTLETLRILPHLLH